MRKNIKISEIITINTNVNECALAFSYQLLDHLQDSNKMLVITANNIKKVYENVEQAKEYIANFDKLHPLTKYLFLKENWTKMHEKYGSKSFQNELISIVENKTFDLYYFHRIDMFFDKRFSENIQKALTLLIESIRYNHKKVIFSYNNQTISGKSFETFLKVKEDISFTIKPGNDNDCDFTMKTYNHLLKKEYASIYLISNDEDITNMHKIIFGDQKNIRFKHFTLDDLQNPANLEFKESDIIIYNDSRKMLDANMIQAFKKLAPYARIFSLSNRKSIRKTDLKESKEAGINLLLPKSFDLKEYIHTIELAIGDEFYTKKLKNLSFLTSAHQVDIKELMQRIAELEKNRIYFSIVTARATDIENNNISRMIRKEDFVFIDKSHDITLFVMINLLPDVAKDVIAERTSINKLLIKYHQKDALAQLIG